jgi:hypothetical protein
MEKIGVGETLRYYADERLDITACSKNYVFLARDNELFSVNSSISPLFK